MAPRTSGCAIHKQTKLTNGRVTKLEKKWIYVGGLIIGGWFVIGAPGPSSPTCTSPRIDTPRISDASCSCS
jgi:hypothetical protein